MLSITSAILVALRRLRSPEGGYEDLCYARREAGSRTFHSHLWETVSVDDTHALAASERQAHLAGGLQEIGRIVVDVVDVGRDWSCYQQVGGRRDQ